ncbi:hypothetical protein Tco_1134304 [Tanacetum coccineum]
MWSLLVVRSRLAMKKNLPKVVAEGIRLEKEKVKDDIVAMVVEVARKEQEQRSATHDKPHRVDVVFTRNHEDHHDGDARPKGGAMQKYKRQLSMERIQEVNHLHHRQWRNQLRLALMHSYMESQIEWERKEEDLTLQIPKKPALVFHSYEIMVKRADGEYKLFNESDYRIYVIWERVYDYQLGLESYQQKVNLTTPTLTFPSIEKEKLLTITSDPLVGLVYENNKKEKTIMDIKEIPKIYDATQKRVLEKKTTRAKKSGNGYLQKDKNKAKTRQNRARDWKESGKPKPKAYAS